MTRKVGSTPRRTTLMLDDRRLLPGGWVDAYVENACNAIPVPPVWNIAAALALAAHDLARWGWTITDGIHTRPALAWAIVSESGSGKGLAISHLRQFLYDFHREAPEVLKDECLFDGETNTYKNTLLEFTGTPEGLFWEAEERTYEGPEDAKRSCVLGAHDEMHELFARSRQHASYFSDMISVLDQRNEIRRTQVNIKQAKKEGGARTGIIPNPTLSALFAAAEPRLRDVLTQEHLTGGFCSRLMWLAQPVNWVDPRDTDESWLLPLTVAERGQGQPALKNYTAWLHTLERTRNGQLVLTQETRELHRSTYGTLRKQYSGSDLRELLARMDVHLLSLAATIAGVMGKLRNDSLIDVEPAHYALARDLYQHVIRGAQWVHKTGQPQDAPAIVDLLHGVPQGMGTSEIRRALGSRYNDIAGWLKALVKNAELVEARLVRGAAGQPTHLFFHNRYYSQIARKLYKGGPAWELTTQSRAEIQIPAG